MSLTNGDDNLTEEGDLAQNLGGQEGGQDVHHLDQAQEHPGGTVGSEEPVVAEPQVHYPQSSSEVVEIPERLSSNGVPLESFKQVPDLPSPKTDHAEETADPAEKDCLLSKPNGGSNGTNGSSKKCPNGKAENGDAGGLVAVGMNGEEKEICVEAAGLEEGKDDETLSSGPGAKKACDIRCIIIGLLVVVIMVGGACVAILAHRFKG